jgi:hypothetical protein
MAPGALDSEVFQLTTTGKQNGLYHSAKAGAARLIGQ